MSVILNGDTQVGVATLSETYNLPQYGGEIWYVNKGAGSNSNDGKTPGGAFETIGTGIAAASSGDAISVAAGTYTELALTLGAAGTVDNLQLIFDIGALLDPASGVALTVAGNSCCVRGKAKITPAGAAGMVVTGAECRVVNMKIVGGDDCYQISGAGAILESCAAGFPTAGNSGFALSGAQTRLKECTTVGNAATYGYLISGGADTGVLNGCTSSGHQTSGFHIATGSQNWTMLHCSSGGGDGRWVDVDTANVWSDWYYSDQVYHTTDWSSVGGGAGSDNIFKVTGAVQIEYIYGDVETIMHADVDNLKLEIDDGAAQANVTANVDTASAPVGSLFIKTKEIAQALTLIVSDQVRINEDSTQNKGAFGFVVNQKAATNSYIRCTWSGTGATGEIHWHCHWNPLTEDGFVEAV